MELKEIGIWIFKGIQILIILILAAIVLLLAFGTTSAYEGCTKVTQSAFMHNIVWIAIIVLVIIAWIWALTTKNPFGAKLQSILCKLVITAIILNIIANIMIFSYTAPIANPCSVLEDGLKNVNERGMYVSQSRKLVLTPPFEYGQKNAQSILPGFKTGDLGVYCIGDFCGPQNELDAPDNQKIVVNKRVTTEVVVCGNTITIKTGTPKYCIVFGKDAATASNECIKQCDLQ
jgi:hypothetical protein